MGKHVNADAGRDEGEAVEGAESAEYEHARHVAGAGHPLEPQAVISSDTHVGVDLGAPPASTPDAAAAPANPNALVEHGEVGDGHEME